MAGPAWLNDDLPFPDGPMGVTHRLSSLNLRYRWEYLAAAEADAMPAQAVDPGVGQ